MKTIGKLSPSYGTKMKIVQKKQEGNSNPEFDMKEVLDILGKEFEGESADGKMLDMIRDFDD